MKNSRENQNIIRVNLLYHTLLWESDNRTLFYKKQEKLISSKKQIIRQGMNSLQAFRHESLASSSGQEKTSGNPRRGCQKSEVNYSLGKNWGNESRRLYSPVALRSKRSGNLGSCCKATHNKLPDVFEVSEYKDSDPTRGSLKDFAKAKRKVNKGKNSTWSVEKQLLNLYLHKKYKSKQVYKQLQESIFKNSSSSQSNLKNNLQMNRELELCEDLQNDIPLLSSDSSKIDQQTFLNSHSQDKTRLTASRFSLAKASQQSWHTFYKAFKQLSIRPSQLNIMLSSIFYFIAICSTLQRRENNRYLSILLQAKIPGYTSLYQNACWESFENLTSKYLVSKTPDSFNRVYKDNYFPKPADFAKAKSFKDPLLGSGVTEGLPPTGVSAYGKTCDISDINFSKDRALLSIRSPWNKQAQKDFRAFFIDTFSTKNINFADANKAHAEARLLQTKSFKESLQGAGTSNKKYESKNILAPWYKIDACVLPSNVVIATRENATSKVVLAKKAGILPTVFKKLDINGHKDNFCDEIKGFEYLIPYYNSKEQIFLQNDSIPSKCNSLELPEYTELSDSDGLQSSVLLDSDVQRSRTTRMLNPGKGIEVLATSFSTAKPDPTRGSLKEFAKAKPKKYSYKYLAAFQRLMNQYFYEDGLLLLNLAETVSPNFISTSTSHATLPGDGSSYQKEIFVTDLLDRVKIEELSSFKNQAFSTNIKQLLNRDQLEAKNSFTGFINTKSGENNSSQGSEQEIGTNRSVKENGKETLNFTDTVGERSLNSDSTKVGFKLLFCNLFRENKWNSMRYVSGYKFPDLNGFSVISLFRQFVIPRALISDSFSTVIQTAPLSLSKGSSLGKASKLVNQVLLTPFRFNVPPALPTCYFKNLILHTDSLNKAVEFKDLTQKVPFGEREEKSKNIDKFKLLYKGITLPEFTEITKVFEKVGIDYQDYLKQPKDSPFAILISPSLEDDDAIKLEAERKTEQGEKKMTPFQLLQDIRQTEQQLENAKDLRPFSAKNVLACQSINGTSAFLKEKSAGSLDSDGLKPYGFANANFFEDSLTSGGSGISQPDFANSKNLFSEAKGETAKFWQPLRKLPEEFFKASFFGEMSLLPKLLVAKDQKEIKEQLLDTNSVVEKHCSDLLPGKKYQSEALPLPSKGRLPNLRLRAEKDIIDLVDPANLEMRNALGAQQRTFKADVQSSLQTSAGDSTKFCYSGGHKRKITSNLFVAPSQQHVTLPQISGRDWKKILEWQLKSYFFDEEKRLQSLREDNPDKHFKMKKLTIYLPWVTFRTPLKNAFEWPLTRLDFTEFVPASLNTAPLQSQSTNFLRSFAPQTQQVDYMIAAKNMTLSLQGNWRDALQAKHINISDNTSKLPVKTSLPNFTFGKSFGFANANSDPLTGSESLDSVGNLSRNKKAEKASKREKLLNKQYLFEGVTNQSYLLIYRLFLLFLLKSVFQYVYRISLRQFLLKMAYSDFGLTVTSPEFREWLQNSTPKSVYKLDKPLQSIAGIEQNISTISQIIWHLRNFGRTRQNIPAVLLLGPTAAEKTSLVQAIASEAKVSVVVQPLDALLSNSISPYEKLEEVFLLARKQAPCVLFLDSIDRIGKSRKNVVSNYAGAEDSLFCLDADIAEGKHDFANLTHSLQTRLLVNRHDPSSTGKTSTFDRFCFHTRSGYTRGGGYSDDSLSDLSLLDQQDANQNKELGSSSPMAFYQEKTEFESLRINLLLRLLTEIDGISPLQGVIVMATSDESAMLDPALLRPGRFQTLIKLSLPDKATRIQLLKVESQKLGSSQSIPWEYLATRTSNMSGADIVSAINHSAIRAILDNTVHTIQSLEHGLNAALGLPKSKSFALFNSKTCNDPFQTSRLAFYQAGKVVVQNLLLEYPNDVFFSLESTFLNTEQKTTNITVEGIQQNLKVVSPDPTRGSLENFAFAKPKQADFEGSLDCDGVKPSGNLLTVASQQLPTLPDLLLRKATGNKKVLSQLQSVASSNQKGNFRSSSASSEANTFFATTRTQFQTRLVALYAAKAAELLQLTSTNVSAKNIPYIDPFTTDLDFYSKPLQQAILTKSDAKNWQSNLAFSDLLTASSIIHAMIDRWYLYSQKLFTFKSNQVFASLNYEQMQEQHDFVLFHKLTKQVYSERAKIGFWSNSSSQEATDQNNTDGSTQQSSINQIIGGNGFSASKQIRQERQKISWWNEKICQEVEMFERPYGKWYRLYLPKVEQRERNEEWVPPDLIFHDFSPLSNLAKDRSTYLKTLHDLYLFERDSAYYNVVMNCFYKAFNLLSDNRELLDFLADHFIRFKVLRSPEMSTICSLYLR